MIVRWPEGKPTSVATNSSRPILAGVLVVGQACDAPVLHRSEKARAIAFAIEHHGEAVQQGIGLELFAARLVRHVLLENRNDVAVHGSQHSRIDRLAHHEERLAVHGVDPVVGGGTQAQPLAGDVVFG